MVKTIKIGVLGCANIAERFVLPAIKQSVFFELVGVASRSEDKADSFASTFNTKAYYSYDSLLESNLDAIYIPLPNGMHYEWIKKSLNKNLHVLVEKSLACDLEQVKELNALARDNSLALIENFQFRFHRQLATIKGIINDGIIGELRCLRSTFGFPPFPEADNIRYQKELGGGALLDAGAYPVKIAQYFLGLDLSVQAANLNYEPAMEVDIWGGAYLKQKNGLMFSEIAFGFDNFYQCSLDLWGSKGRVYTNRIFTAPPDYAPKIVIETKTGSEIIMLEPDNPFENLLKYFHGLIISSKEERELEYNQNINQSRILEEMRTKANAE